ncbi:uncharacterized protein LOC135477474 [Liolophura sinensis]|uniref:uncharacterized protein LOC135477474 n=1 Tax=Liolophura sinensis TaxID=3198878 RepID=UPI003158D502
MAGARIKTRAEIPGASYVSSAILAARVESVSHNTATLFNLIKPVPGDSQRFQSNEGIVNVVPRGRIYRLETLSELDTFKVELLRRPTVLQCQFRTGTGMAGCPYFPAFDCRLGTTESDWLIMLNQLHPKILSRYQMGIDMIRKAMVHEVPCVLQFNFNERLRDLMVSLVGPSAENHSYFNCDFAEMLVIYSGKSSRVSDPKNIAKSREIMFNFDDISNNDVLLQTAEKGAEIQIGSPQTEGDLKRYLRGWEFSLSEDPSLEPRSRYSYATAGRMFYDLQRTDDIAESEM